MTIGSADLFTAIADVWRDNSLDTAFKAYWPNADRTKYLAINDTEAEGGQPYPYCIFSMMAGKEKEKMTGTTADTNRVLRDVPCNFKVFAKDPTTGSLSAKQIAAAMAAEIIRIYGGHPDAVGKLEGRALSYGHILSCNFQSEFAEKIDVEVWAWSVNYILRLDIPFKV
jgi:hypothetical protein